MHNWIWLPKDKFPNSQETILSGFYSQDHASYTVAEFTKKYNFDKEIISAELMFSADTAFRLYCNGKFIGTGPASVGGDFMGNETKRENFYAYKTTIAPASKTLEFFARVKMMPFQICEYSAGRGGFMLCATLLFADGTKTEISTDEEWLVRRVGAYKAPLFYDGRIEKDSYYNAETVEDVWHVQIAPIPVRCENELVSDNSEITLGAFEKRTTTLEFDKIWAGFISVKVKAKGEVHLKLYCRELDEEVEPEELIFSGDDEYVGFYMHSAGNILAALENHSSNSCEVKISFLETHYPIFEECETKTSDSNLNSILETCKHTLKICRQTHHLDSPRHCEPLACTGDYYIESLMTPFSFGDLRLCEFDIMRTALMLEREDGRLFHTTYSLIWVQMLWDVYMVTGNKQLLADCKKGLELLLQRFDGYTGENGLIENPPDYMFVDWIYIDGITLHHPPKALGQTCLNMFYFGALKTAAKIFCELGENAKSEECATKSKTLGTHINNILFDQEKDIYFMGLNTPTEEKLIGNWMPQNVTKRYYLKHANILAAYFGVADDEASKKLIDKIMSNEIEGDVQPYFLHYLLEAVCRLGMREKYTMEIINMWKNPVKECPKGLVEGFYKPEPYYSFDHSHAWGGTPLYSFPKAVMGLKILAPGMKEISLNPNSLGLEFVNVCMLTPLGRLTVDVDSTRGIKIVCPEGIKIVE